MLRWCTVDIVLLSIILFGVLLGWCTVDIILLRILLGWCTVDIIRFRILLSCGAQWISSS